ncbi:hypothetical protein Tco_0914510, partial [Tanacetum coccineum]
MANILAKEMIGLSFPPTMESKHDSRVCIYGALVSVDTNEIFLNNEFPILDVGRKIISKNNGEETIKLNGFELINDVVAKGEGGFNVSSFMNEAILKGFKRGFGIIWNGPLVMDFCADNHPPMLDKDLYDSWKSRMELYMQNREHIRMILESVEHGPLIWPTVEENGVIRTKKYA